MDDTMEPSNSELCRRVDKIEDQHDELQGLLRETAFVNARLTETLAELKEEFREFRSDMKKIRDIEMEIAHLKVGFAIMKWLGGAIGGGGVVMILAYLFENHSAP